LAVWLVALLWLSNDTTTAVMACSCFGPITFNNALRDESLTAAKIMIRNEIFPNGPFDDEVGNGIRYFRAQVVRPYRGCRLSRGQNILVSTGGNSAMCGSDLRAQTEYLLFGSQQEETIKGLGTRQVLQVNVCNYQVPFRLVSRPQLHQLARFRYVDNCRPELCDQVKKCGPPPPVAPPIQCPDGSMTFYDINCVKTTSTTGSSSSCRWDVKSSSCPACSEDADCSLASYCSAGLCRTKDTCGTKSDCWNPSIDGTTTTTAITTTSTTTTSTTTKDLPCLAEQRECTAVVSSSNSCTSTCCDKKDVVNCFIDPCDTVTVPYHTCVSDYCGGCNAYAFDQAGHLVSGP
jgi:hypothetical protein